MKNLLIAALFAAAAMTPAAAQTVNAGTYAVEGTNLDGSSYEGTATITLASDTTCVIEWKTGGTTSEGVCMLHEDAFAAAYMLDGAIGLVVYKVLGNGVLEGSWTLTGKDGSGTETLTEQE